MNFLNDSLKSLKSVLAEGLENLDQRVDFEGSEHEEGAHHSGGQEHENIRKLCQHQAEEVKRNVFIIALFRRRALHMTALFSLFDDNDETAQNNPFDVSLSRL
jgi:hypothetical protein